MKNKDDSINLSRIEKKDLAIQTFLEFIPYVGGALSTGYYGYKHEIRLKRLEIFYEEFSDRLKDKEGLLIRIEDHDKNALMAIIEELNEKVETETLSRKRKFLKNYFENILTSSTNETNYDARRTFLKSLSDMSLFDCDVMIDVKASGKSIVKELPIFNEHNMFEIFASISKLESYGYIKSNQSNYILTELDNEIDFEDQRSLTIVVISPLGEKFLKFCIEDK